LSKPLRIMRVPVRPLAQDGRLVARLRGGGRRSELLAKRAFGHVRVGRT
jgi:hypothetical protein